MSGDLVQLDEEWRLQAKCASLPPAEADRLFFSNAQGNLAEGRRFCRSCPVVVECFRYSLDAEVTTSHGSGCGLFGIWGGIDRRERGRLLYRRQRVVA